MEEETPQVAFHKKKNTPAAVPEPPKFVVPEHYLDQKEKSKEDQLKINGFPLPKQVGSYYIQELYRQNRAIYEVYLPFKKEHHIYSQVLLSTPQVPENLSTLRVRVEENLERAHWFYIWCLKETLDKLTLRSSDLEYDKTVFFMAQMKIIEFLMETLDALGGGQKYFRLTREFYILVNLHYLKRIVKERDL